MLECETTNSSQHSCKTESTQGSLRKERKTSVHCFSSRLYGLRNYKKKLKEVLGGDKDESLQDGNQTD